MEILRMINVMDMESTRTLMGVATRVCGVKISSMELEKKFGIMEQRLMKVNSFKERNTEKGSSCGVMVHTMKVTLLKESSMAWGLTTSKNLRRLIMDNSQKEELKEMVR